MNVLWKKLRNLAGFFLKAKKISVEFNKNMGDEELWNIHAQAIRKKPGQNVAKKNLLDLKIELGKRLLKKCEVNRYKETGTVKLIIITLPSNLKKAAYIACALAKATYR